MVERPASVVRELVDNALDAGATQVTVRLLAGGVRLISVEDDGAAFRATSCRWRCSRHATSKIAILPTWNRSAPWAFAARRWPPSTPSPTEPAVARRRRRPVPSARRPHRRTAARWRAPPAPRWKCKELFFSTPARRKFLKTDATELAHCIEAVRRHALARPDVGFAIWHEGKLVEQWRACGTRRCREQRLADVLGSDFIAQVVAVDYARRARCASRGRAGIPDAARARADQQFCYVNGRFVRDKVLTHAARSAYEDVLHGQRQPVYALYVEIDPARVDVNVHPTKIEVRFRDSREVHQAVRHAVENALAAPRAAAALAAAAAAAGSARQI